MPVTRAGHEDVGRTQDVQEKSGFSDFDVLFRTNYKVYSNNVPDRLHSTKSQF